MAYKINGTTVINNSGELENVSAVSGPMTINEMPVLNAATNNDLHIKAGWELVASETITNSGSANRAIFEARLPGMYNSQYYIPPSPAVNVNIASRYDLIHIDVLYFRGDETASNRGFPGFQLGTNTSTWTASNYESKGFDYYNGATSQGYANTPTNTLPSYGYTFRPTGFGNLYPTDHNFVSLSHTIYNANDFFQSTTVHTRAWAISTTGSMYMSEYWTQPRGSGAVHAIRWLEDPSASVSGNNLSLSYNMYVPQSEYTEEYL